MSEAQDVWSLIWKIGEYAIGIITAIAAFIIKGYHDEFKQLKTESEFHEIKERVIRLETINNNNGK